MSTFNKTNKFGRYCVEAIIPGWGSANIESGAVESGMIRGVGRRQVQYPMQQLGSPTAPSAAIDTYPMMGQDQWGNQARWIENKSDSSTNGFYFADAVGDEQGIGIRRRDVVEKAEALPRPEQFPVQSILIAGNHLRIRGDIAVRAMRR